MEFHIILLTFFLGMVFHKIFASLFVIGTATTFSRNMSDQALKLLRAVVTNVNAALEIKYDLLSTNEDTKTMITQMRIIDQANLQVWKSVAIKSYIKSYPPTLQRELSFKDWDEAMIHLVSNDQKE
tara:strand:+ start:9796 stop:10173 length:378 start_codon:yes stop_codon:yes gene_type:complete